MRELIEQKEVQFNGKTIRLEDVSHVRPGDAFAFVIDTKFCQAAIDIAKGAKMLLCESTYLEEHRELAEKHLHLTAKQAATIAKEAGVDTLILTHFSARYLELEPFEKEAKEIFSNVYAADDLKRFPFLK